MASKNDASAVEHASLAEVVQAINSMSYENLARVGKAAKFRAKLLVGLGVSADDLLQDAIERTCMGKRHWRKGVTFVKHLEETMRSIANHARDELKGGRVVAVAALTDMSEVAVGATISLSAPDPLMLAAAHERMDRITKHFENDEDVGMLIEGLSTGMSGTEIKNDLGWSETTYEAVMMRLRRGINRKDGWRP